MGWSEAKETLRICCDQDVVFADQWSLITERFAAHFGDDGEALARKSQRNRHRVQEMDGRRGADFSV